MSDALSRNGPDQFERFIAYCLCHGRREFVKLIEQYPQECRYVLESLRDVYVNDAHTKELNMSNEQRMLHHQEHSEPIMEKLREWLKSESQGKNIEPNSSMGKAIKYMLTHWKKLTLFLEVPGAPLDNNICERAIKVFIRYRKNSMFYKTEYGAYVGDFAMSLIHTCKLNAINAFEYLKALARFSDKVSAQPDRWLPWNYQENLT